MKVYNLCCEHDHRFEGWFSSEDDFNAQSAQSIITCPMCGSPAIKKLLSAPRLNLSGAQSAQPVAEHGKAQAAFLALARDLLENTEDVGDQFAEEARRIHYNEAPERGIRGVATQDERAALKDEGIAVMAFDIPKNPKETLH
jgi:hypothetical protein